MYRFLESLVGLYPADTPVGSNFSISACEHIIHQADNYRFQVRIQRCHLFFSYRRRLSGILVGLLGPTPSDWKYFLSLQ